MEFKDAWDFIVKRSAEACIPVVQDKAELEYVFNLMRGYNSYLEIGTAEGNSLYVLANAMPEGSEITYVDLGEHHTTPHRNAILDRLTDYKISAVHGDSNDFSSLAQIDKSYDAVLIDAGHETINVVIDAMLYGPLAKKLIIFHDVQLPAVRKAYDWYCRQRPECRNFTIINSQTYGFGILEINK